MVTLMYMCMPHVNTLKNNVKFFKVFKSKITKTQIVLQWAIRMQKKLYILKPYTKLSLPKKILTARHLRRKFEGVGGLTHKYLTESYQINTHDRIHVE